MKKRVLWTEKRDVVDSVTDAIKHNYIFIIGLVLLTTGLLATSAISQNLQEFKKNLRIFGLLILCGLYLSLTFNPWRMKKAREREEASRRE